MIGAFAAAVVLSSYAAVSTTTAGHVGIIATAICVCMFAAPLTVVAQVVKNRSSELLPPVQCLMQFLTCGFWLVVGVRTSALPVIVCNSLGFLLACTQLGLIAVYPQQNRCKNSLIIFSADPSVRTGVRAPLPQTPALNKVE